MPVPTSPTRRRVTYRVLDVSEDCAHVVLQPVLDRNRMAIDTSKDVPRLTWNVYAVLQHANILTDAETDGVERDRIGNVVRAAWSSLFSNPYTPGIFPRKFPRVLVTFFFRILLISRDTRVACPPHALGLINAFPRLAHVHERSEQQVHVRYDIRERGDGREPQFVLMEQTPAHKREEYVQTYDPSEQRLTVFQHRRDGPVCFRAARGQVHDYCFFVFFAFCYLLFFSFFFFVCVFFFCLLLFFFFLHPDTPTLISHEGEGKKKKMRNAKSSPVLLFA
jgi:hypothetical protein